MEEHRYEKWKAKVLATDSDAEFDNDDIRRARHSHCGTFITMKDPCDITRWNGHLKDCKRRREAKKSTGKSQSLFKMGWLTGGRKGSRNNLSSAVARNSGNE